MKIEVYGTNNCPWCTKLIGLLEAEGIQHTYKVLVTEKDKDFLRDQGIGTVPAVFINDTYVGGHDDTVVLIENGEI